MIYFTAETPSRAEKPIYLQDRTACHKILN